MKRPEMRACARCGRPCTTGSNTRQVVVCRDCRSSDDWYVQHATREDQRRKESTQRRRVADRTADDLVAVLRNLARWQVFERLEHPVELDVCAACGSLERADRACQVCRARRAVA